MTKTLLIPSNREMMEEFVSFCDGFLLGIEGLSVNFPLYIKLEELKEYSKIKKQGKSLFVVLNKNIHNHDLEYLKKTLQELENYPIDGIFYYDVAIINLKEKLHLSYPMIWSQEHLTTNASTCNFWANHGVNGAYLSSEITLEEIKTIRKQTKMTLFVSIFGHLPMFTSKRHLIKNYLTRFQLHESNQYYIEKEGKIYPIVDDNNGTTVYSNYILNAIPEYLELEKIGIEYVILNSFQIEPLIVKTILKEFSLITKENKETIFQTVNQLCNNNVEKGFLYKETVYKMKGDE